LHGTAASTHSWAGLAPLLAEKFDVVAIDLPGHGFSSSLKKSATIENVCVAINALLALMAIEPTIIVGHSAGAAIGVKLAIDRPDLRLLVGVSPALTPFDGAAGFVFPMMAKLIHLNPASAPMIAAAAGDRRRVERLISQTGSKLSAEGVELYARLLRYPGHIRGALSMMAGWDLSTMPDQLAKLRCGALFIIGGNDKATPPKSIETAAAFAAHADCWTVEGLGHLLHEEDPKQIAQKIIEKAAAH
jgi:magnesium chelatase accessory protein